MINSKWSVRIENALKLGLWNIAMCHVTSLRYKLLWKKYRFDPWHCSGNWYCRPYQRVAVRLVNSVSPRVVVEVGCGLGEIISRVKCLRRIGYDIDQAVIDAARYLRGQKVEFKVGTWSDVNENRLDVLIAVNWIHNLSPMELKNALEPLFDRVTYFLLERIMPGQPGYRFYHDFSFLEGRAKLVARAAGGVREPRELMLFKVAHNDG